MAEFRRPATLAMATLCAVVGVGLGASAPRAPGSLEQPLQVAGGGDEFSQSAAQVPPDFTHGEHGNLQCFECHDTRQQHGALLVNSLQQCRSCHHSASRAVPCAGCHAADDAPDQTFRVVRAVAFSVGTRDATRALAFPHDAHGGLDCARCHTQGVERAVATDLDCTSCHQDHHTAQSDCGSCHTAAPVSAHPPSEAHVTCSGAACHQSVPFRTVPRTRDFCLGCHQGMRDHEAPRACAECHQLPAPRPQVGGLE